MSRPSQKEEILQYMREHEWITPMESIHHIGCTRLAARISDLIRDGYSIEKETVYYQDYFKRQRHYTRYRLAVG